MTTKLEERLDKYDGKMSENTDEIMDEDVSVDIEITDNQSEPEVKNSSQNDTENVVNCDNNKVSDNVSSDTAGLIERTTSPIPLIKKLNRDGSKHVTRNWLISDCPKRKVENKIPEITSKSESMLKSLTPSENQENSVNNLIRVEDLVNKKHSTVRTKPVNELLKQFREIKNQSPFHNTNENFKVEMEDERIKPVGGKLLMKASEVFPS
ncbi:CLUMA_CG006717, isoform A [Clunio marinus]|uniref:CLUMA_CG006717, isoform A n=1 Tax=Clunio marinus TaxID=568069 RepID=A0A1J1HYS2_9DIPT|nr:CLUMA_CG006717, isoform A [Clunio marinus]